MKKFVTNESYHRDRFAISSTSLSHYAECPAKYKAWLDNILTGPSSDALNFGSAYHTAVLEANKFDDEILVIPKIDKRTKEGKEKAMEYEIKAQGRSTIQMDEKITIDCMIEKLREHDAAAPLLQQGIVEESFFWEQPLDYEPLDKTRCNYCWHPMKLSPSDIASQAVECPECKQVFNPTAILCKARPDLYTEGYILDLKTSDNANPEAFKWKKVIRGYRYDRQAAIQLLALEAHDIHPEDYYWVVQEKTIPYVVSVIKADASILSKGKADLLDLLMRLKASRDNDSWPGYPGIQTIGVSDGYSSGIE